ncbi:MAG TPA: hypothetical protein VFS16_02210 [Acidimicrobiia bacterium]|nr:hypothetical protein [Acidimicrobiia bacterium]
MSSSSAKRLSVVGLGLVLATGVGTWLATAGDTGNRPMPPATQARSLDAPAPAPASDLVEFRDDAAGFALSYPKAWVRATAPNPQIALVAAEQDPAKNLGGSILVRVTPLDAPVGKAELGETRKATDALVTSSEGVALRAEPTETELGGLPGLYYLYTFRDPVSGLVGAHSHYFLFKGSTMISIIFQALPDGHFARLAPLFDRVAGSLRVL